MDHRSKASLLWGLVGALAFLVLVQGYQLVTVRSVTVPVAFGGALAVGAVTTALAYGLEGRLGPNESP